jgi:nitroreductase
MDLLDAIHTRRTVKKRYAPDPVPRDQLERILDAARWAPCHRMTEPWRFRVVGPVTLGRLLTVAGEGGKKLLRAPTLVVASYVPSPLPLHAAEDEQAAACAVYAVLLAATAEGLASYWRTPGILRSAAGRAALQLPEEERTLGLLHFGWAAGTAPPAPERRGIEEYVSFLD